MASLWDVFLVVAVGVVKVVKFEQPNQWRYSPHDVQNNSATQTASCPKGTFACLPRCKAAWQWSYHSSECRIKVIALICSSQSGCKAPPRCSCGLRSSGILRGVGWYLTTDVSGQHMSPVAKGQAVQEEEIVLGFLDPWRWDRYFVPKRR
jgi:hypothetical protein